MAVFFSVLAAAQATPIVLYNGSLNTLPEAQGWSFGTLGSSFTESVGGGATILTTTPVVRAGYGILSPLPLDRTAGYQVFFELQLDSETHVSPDRAGLSVIVVGNDLKGIELGFWAGDVWAQNVGFTHGEDAPYNTALRTLYALIVNGSTYQLNVGNTPLLSGSLRDYSGGGPPYTFPNSIFVGDDTFSADATMRFSSAVLNPEPGTALLGMCALALAAAGVKLSSSRQSANR